MKQPKPEELLYAARAAEVRVVAPEFTRADYGEAIHTLRYEKQWTWKQIGEWLTAKGCRSTAAAATSAATAWRRREGLDLNWDAKQGCYVLEKSTKTTKP